MRRFLLISIAIICCLFVGCEQGGKESTTPPPEQISVSNIDNNVKEFVVADYTEITFSGLDTDGLYGIFPEMTGSRASVSPEADSPGLIVTDAGTRLLKPETDTVTLSGSDVGISGAGTVKILKYEESTEATIDTEKDRPLYHDDIENADVYEKYSKVDISDFEDKNLALLFYDYNKEKGGVSMSTDYGVIDPESGSLSRDAKSHGVMNFEGKETVEIFNQVRHRDGSAVVSMVLVQNPEVISESDTTEIKNKQLYRINKESWGDKTVVMELKLNDGIHVENLFLADGATDIRYASGAKNGQRHPYFFPLSWDESSRTVVIYIGQIDEDIIFDVAANNDISEIGTATLREIKEEKPQEIRVADSRVEEITIDKDSYFTPVILLGGEYIRGMNMKAEFDGPFSVLLVEGHTSGVGYSQCGLSSGDTRYDRRGRDSSSFLEYVVIKNYDVGKQGGSVTLSFSRDNDFTEAAEVINSENYSDFIFGQKYLIDFQDKEIVLEIKLPDSSAFNENTIEAFSDINFSGIGTGLHFIPVHYVDETNTVYVYAGLIQSPVLFSVGNSDIAQATGSIKAVEKSDIQDADSYFTPLAVSKLPINEEIQLTGPFKAFRIIWQKDSTPPDALRLSYNANSTSIIVNGLLFSKDGKYFGSIKMDEGSKSSSFSDCIMTNLLVANTNYNKGEETKVTLEIDDLN